MPACETWPLRAYLYTVAPLRCANLCRCVNTCPLTVASVLLKPMKKEQPVEISPGG